MGSDLSLATGDAFDVKVKPVVEKRERLGLFRWRTTMHYTLTNALPRGVTVDLLQAVLWCDTRIFSESARSEEHKLTSSHSFASRMPSYSCNKPHIHSHLHTYLFL